MTKKKKEAGVDEQERMAEEVAELDEQEESEDIPKQQEEQEQTPAPETPAGPVPPPETISITVPNGFIERLRAAADDASKIGVATGNVDFARVTSQLYNLLSSIQPPV